MNHRLSLLPALAVLPALTGCQAVDSVVTYFGPRPDETLETLAQQATADAATLDDADASSLRQEQADALYAEITRLCGTENGEVPESCEVDPNDTSEVTGQDDLEASLRSTLDGVGEVSMESRALVVDQAIDLAARTNPVLPSLEQLGEDETTQARELLEWEYRQVYGLDVARAFVDPSLENTVDARITMHEERIQQLQEVLHAVGDIPQPKPAYTSDEYELPHDATSAEQFINDLAWADTVEWANAATTHAESLHSRDDSTAWRDWLIITAAQSRAV